MEGCQAGHKDIGLGKPGLGAHCQLPSWWVGLEGSQQGVLVGKHREEVWELGTLVQLR